ncbi:MAG TPA: nickel-responsive transcriptional regulator NikR [Thermodesulfobacteriota bacterium]|nr:nickel-responsive transcriptional regulator NikR [Deltaproteobacteria bacterium]HNR11902.1 nickel-responsive transcriptional regulator NikR [Thermodesulfobacteriota bacterium]HNU70425.1 nickel-responsive transcriptional regulator NikR [Thermodesulfobacteriota bacterium]HOC38118.1 nickel-responsive transcriptional regulator NikR [Thermodesulfobacteriota bacterium]
MKLIRFGVSMPEELLGDFDRYITARNYQNRSEALRDMIRDKLVEKEWADAQQGQEVVGAITFVYDHHKRELVNALIDIQHDYTGLVLASQHIHLDHDHCLEVSVVRGSTEAIRTLTDRIKSMKGVKHTSLSMTTTGKRLT